MNFNKKKNKTSHLNELPELLQIRAKPKNELEIENLVLKDIKKKILNDEMNQLQFYDIVQPDQDEMILSLKDTIKKPMRLHKRAKRSDLEQRLRNKLASEPGNLLLLQEIYEKFEEDNDGPILKRHKGNDQEQYRESQQYKPESDEQLVANLDVWHKQVKIRLKEQADKLKQEQERQKQALLQEQNNKQAVVSMRRGGSTVVQGSDQLFRRKGTIGTWTPAFPKIQQQMLETISETSNQGGESLFKTKLMTSLAKLSVKKKNEIESKDDSSVQKQLDKYINQGSSLTQNDIQKIEQARANQKSQPAGNNSNDTLIFEYTVEGLKRSLHTLIKMQITTFHNAMDRSLFYEKQTNSILVSVKSKLETQQKEVIKNDKELEVLRLENHDIHAKLRSIQNLLVDLEEDVKHVNSPKEKKSVQISQSTLNFKSNSSQIDNYMATVGKQHELEEQIDLMRDSQKQFNAQVKLNSAQIIKLEADNQKLNKSNKGLTKALQGFYLELLNVGLDCRRQGLWWIVKAIWESGEKIADNNFPPYLDSKAREFILLKCRKINELNQLFIKSQQLFSNYQNKDTMDVQNNSIVSLLSKNHFSQIDSNEIKQQALMRKTMSQKNEISLLMHGLTTKEKEYIGHSIVEINTGKETMNDIIYQEAQSRISKMFKSSFEFYPADKQSPQYQTLNNQAAQQEQQSIISIADTQSDVKDRLIKEYTSIQKEIQNKEIQFKKFEEAELQRLVKEIDYKNYLQRFNVEALQILSALFGYHKAERELIKYGIMRGKQQQQQK